jgi:D-tyrosyl-tRNA(Tyr) deacylase
MKIVLQRVKCAQVRVQGTLVTQIGTGFLLLVGIGPEDDEKMLEKAAKKMVDLRIFEDTEGKMNLNLKQIGGEILAVSQFTLYADCRKGNRPYFTGAAEPRKAEILFIRFVDLLKEQGVRVGKGIFGERMEVELVNWGPVTICLEF